MPVTVALSGKPSATRNWTATVIVEGLSSNADLGGSHVWIGAAATNTPPTAPMDLSIGTMGSAFAQPRNYGIKTLTVADHATGRLVYRQLVTPGDMGAMVAGNYVIAGVSESEDASDPFTAVSTPLRTTY